jgi:hypothetical protein
VSHRVHCDYQGCVRTDGQRRVRWLVVQDDPDNIELARFGGLDGPRHFCSWEHLAAYAQQRAGVTT